MPWPVLCDIDMIVLAQVKKVRWQKYTKFKIYPVCGAMNYVYIDIENALSVSKFSLICFLAGPGPAWLARL